MKFLANNALLTLCAIMMLWSVMAARATGDDLADVYFDRAIAEAMAIADADERFEAIALVAEAMYTAGRKERAHELVRPFLRRSPAEAILHVAMRSALDNAGVEEAMRLIDEVSPPERRSDDYAALATCQADRGDIVGAREAFKRIEPGLMADLAADIILAAELAAGETSFNDVRSRMKGNEGRMWLMLRRTAQFHMTTMDELDGAEETVAALPAIQRIDLLCMFASSSYAKNRSEEARKLVREAVPLLDQIDRSNRFFAEYKIALAAAGIGERELAERLQEMARAGVAKLEAGAAENERGYWDEMSAIDEFPLLLLLDRRQEALEMARNKRYQDVHMVREVGEVLQPEGTEELEAFLKHIDGGKMRAAVWSGAAVAAAQSVTDQE